MDTLTSPETLKLATINVVELLFAVSAWWLLYKKDGTVKNVDGGKTAEGDWAAEPFGAAVVPAGPGTSAKFLGDSLKVDEKDDKTPDEWVRRHPDLVRLTGRHPFNCEPPLANLKKGGFLTPAHEHYVRNHGAVPVSYKGPSERQAVWDTWKVKIHGLVDKPIEISMDELAALPQRELPVLLVCAGNRRKEQNRVAKTVGFNWGASGCATNVWTGVRLCDLLKLAKIKSKAEGAGHVCFVGPKKELPKGDDGTYGTSITWDVAMDPAQDVLIAYKQNGQFLEPDHGYPVRLIIPGYIGGRMIKWLTEIEVTREQSDNFYHFMDNRVLPVGVTPESATTEGWWYKPDYIINNLNVNSAMWSPAHAEKKDYNPKTMQEVSGYAYTGNGMKIIRAEISLDNGETWELAEIDQETQKPTEYGKYWTWAFWKTSVPMSRLLGCDEIMVRAWDACQNTQPKDLTWNVMGMMNNPWFRVRVHKCVDPAHPDPEDPRHVQALQFEHPTLPGQLEGGWMAEEDQGWKKTATGAVFGLAKHVPAVDQPLTVVAGAPTKSSGGLAGLFGFGSKEKLSTAAAPPAAAAPAAGGLRRIPMSEVAKHTTEQDSWFVVNGKVYDSTEYNKEHPGGADSIVMVAGEDATADFEAIHSKKAWALLEKFCIGVVDDGAPASGTAAATSAGAENVLLNLKKKQTVVLREKKVVGNDGTNDVLFLKLGFPKPDMKLGLPTGKHFMVYAQADGATVARAYTPISNDLQFGSVDLVVKVYAEPGKEGKMSSHMGKMQVGDTLELRGPIGHVEYTRGVFKLHGEPHPVRHVGMLAGGTGITPMFQIIQTAVLDPLDTTCFHLIYANRSDVGVMLEQELDTWSKNFPGRVTVEYVVNQSTRKDKRSSVGHISKDLIEEYICKPAGGMKNIDFMFMCGPKPMIDRACIPCSKELGFKDEQFIQF